MPLRQGDPTRLGLVRESRNGTFAVARQRLHLPAEPIQFLIVQDNFRLRRQPGFDLERIERRFVASPSGNNTRTRAQLIGARLVDLDPLHAARIEHHFCPAAVFGQPTLVVQRIFQTIRIFQHVVIGGSNSDRVTLPVPLEALNRIDEITLRLRERLTHDIAPGLAHQRHGHRQITCNT